MPYNHYLQISEQRYNMLCQRFEKYMVEVDDISKEPFKLFDPLNAQQLKELDLIREVSKNLQNKKEEDRKKAAEAEIEAEKAAKEGIESENPKENKEIDEHETEEFDKKVGIVSNES